MKRLIIIGGGFAGASIAKELEDTFDVTLIDSKEYFEYTPGVLRALVDLNHLRTIRVLHKHYLHKAKVLIGKVTSLAKDAVVVNGKKLSFDYLVIASGSRYQPPIKMGALDASNISLTKQYHEKIKQSKTILVIGGGLVGIELAAELCAGYPSKKIILSHAYPHLADRMGKKASQYFYDYLTKKGVTVVTDARVMDKKGNSFFTTKGEKISADIAFFCTGIKPNSQFLKKPLDDKSYIIVNDYLQVNENTFAVGDVNNIREERTAQNAEEQAKTVIKNLLALDQGKRLSKYVPTSRIMVTSLGGYNGVITYKNFCLTGIIAALLKRIIEWRVVSKYKFGF